MAKKPNVHAHPDKVALYEAVVATQPEVERKGDKMPYTSINGNMFSYIDPDGKMALRLPADEREAFLAKYDTKLFEAYGIVQKEYVTVPEQLLTNTGELKLYFAVSYEYARGLKPKPTKRAK